LQIGIWRLGVDYAFKIPDDQRNRNGGTEAAQLTDMRLSEKVRSATVPHAHPAIHIETFVHQILPSRFDK